MPINKKLVKYLEENKIRYEIVNHRMVYTAYDLAATMKIKMNQIAKSLLVKFNKPFIQGEKPYALAVVPADKNIDLKKLVKVVNEWAAKLNKELRLKKPERGKKQIVDLYSKIRKAELPKEKAMKDKFNVTPGTMAALGRLYKLPVFVDKRLRGTMLFASGSFTESIRLAAADYIKLEQAMTGNFSVVKRAKSKK